MKALYRLFLYAYPARFRREYGDEMYRVLQDQLVHERRTATQIVAREITDVARTALHMRWESPMTRVILIVLAATAAITAVLVGGPFSVLVLAALVALGLLLHAGRDRHVEEVLRRRRWTPWAAVAVVALGTAVAIAQLADGELSAVWWSVMAIAFLVGIAAAVVALTVFLTHRSGTTPAPRGGAVTP